MSTNTTRTTTSNAPHKTTTVPLELLPDLLSRKQLASLLQVSVTTLAKKSQTWHDILPIIRLRNSNFIRYRKADVLKLLEPNSHQQSNQGGM